MFFYDNGEICVTAFSRCGHTSMYEHFGLPVYSINGKISDFANSKTKKKVLVVRNPYDRLLSAVNNSKTLKENNVSSDDYTQWTIDHSIPLLQDQRLLNLDFKIIDFYKLNRYIGVSKVTVVTNSVGAIARKPVSWLCSKSIYDDYMMLYHSQEEMEREYQAYRSIMISHDEISVPEWKLMVDFLDKK